MNVEKEIQLLMNQIRIFQKEIDENPYLSSDVIESIRSDIEYYQNQIDYLVESKNV